MVEIVSREFPIALTFDIDWAPDFAIQKVVSILEEHNVPGTFFLTHNSTFIESLKNHPLIELGIHPNFLPDSSHGQNIDEILIYVLNLCTNATAMRTHGLYQYSRLYFHILKKYPQIRHDFSLYIPENPYIKIFNFEDDDGNYITRIPYQWEDDMFFYVNKEYLQPKPILFEYASYQIFNFHPIHVYLNSKSSLLYNNLKTRSPSPLSRIQEYDAKSYIYEGFGACSQLQNILAKTTKNRFVFATYIPHLVASTKHLYTKKL